ncbi:general secretion pathway protein F [Pseudomonas sp. BAY1663]|nr:general secretion pathway protein F [Pseudomonas sp. BAY1663]
MAAFEYIALDPRGRQQKGLIEADSPRQARQLLRDRQWAPLEVKQAKSKEDAGHGGFGFGRGLSARDLALVTRQLATLVQAALPIEEALRAAAAQSTSAKIKSMLLAVRARVMEGHSLAAALREYPSAFPELYRATVAAGEHAGHLGLVLDQLADYTDQRQQSRQKIQLALLYPVILLVASLAIVVLLLGYVVPDVVKVFVNTGQELPVLTRGLIATSDLVKDWGWLILLGGIGAALAMRAALRDETLRLRWHASSCACR